MKPRRNAKLLEDIFKAKSAVDLNAKATRKQNMKRPSDNAIQLEVKKIAMRQSKDGLVLSLLLHPNDVASEIISADIGTVYMAAFVRLGDDSSPQPSSDIPDKQPEQKARRPFDTLQLSNQAGIRVGDKSFLEFLDVSNESDAVECIYLICGITSRRELDTDEVAGKKWLTLEKDYQAWLTTMRYKDSIHAGAGQAMR